MRGNKVLLESKLNKFIKRSFDLFFTLFVILFVLIWLLPIIAILIKLGSRGPVFFVQKRTGIDNKTFHCIKFRSMYLNEEAHEVQASKFDQRVTSIGVFLRKFSLDELPQFLNVLVGQMSIVGPRPLMIKHTKDQSQQIDNFQLRHQIKPGITGLSQIRGFRGEMVDNRMLRGRLKIDLFYLNHWSLLLDFFIIAKSIKLMLFGDDKAY